MTGGQHPLASRRVLRAEDLAEQFFITYAADVNDEGHLDTLRRVFGHEPRFAYKVSSNLSVVALVAAGLGLALLPAPLRKFGAPNVVFRLLADSSMKSELVVVSRIGGEWDAAKRYLDRLGY